METPPPSQQPSSSDAPPPVIRQTTFATSSTSFNLPSNYEFNDPSIPNGPGTFTYLDEADMDDDDHEVANINTAENIALADLQRDLARQRKAQRKAQEAQERKSSSSVGTEGRSSTGRATSRYSGLNEDTGAGIGM